MPPTAAAALRAQPSAIAAVIAAYVYDHLSLRQVAAAFGISRTLVTAILAEHSIPRRPARRYSGEHYGTRARSGGRPAGVKNRHAHASR